MGDILHKKFDKLNFLDPFFESYREEYPDFEERFRFLWNWEDVYVLMENWHVIGLTYFRLENGYQAGVEPPIYERNILRVELFKLEEHGMVQKEQFLKILFDYALEHRCPLIYMTFNPWDKVHLKMIKRYGFTMYGKRGRKLAFVKRMDRVTGDYAWDYPLISLEGHKKYLLAIKQEPYNMMFPEYPWTMGKQDLRFFMSEKNSIHKIAICDLPGVVDMEPGDVLLIAKRIDRKGGMELAYVGSELGVVDGMRHREEFDSFEAFLQYARTYDYFDEAYLRRVYDRGNFKLLHMTNNVMLRQPMVKQEMIYWGKLKRNVYWNFMELNDDQVRRVAEYGRVGHVLY